jgi:hypothetical protein
MKTYKFIELNDKAKCIAVYEYRRGLVEGRDWSEDTEDMMTITECYDCCIDTNNEIEYYADGSMVESDDE